MTSRVLIKDLSALADGPVTVSGWVDTVRDQKKVQFIVLRDESGAAQLVNPALRALPVTDAEAGTVALEGEELAAAEARLATTEAISDLANGSFITVTGQLKQDERVKLGGLEVKIESLTVVTEAIAETPIATDSGLDKRMDWRFLDLRHPKQNLIFKIQTTFLHAMREYWVDNDFIEIQTPKLMASASESRAELFEVEYFEGKAYLAQSPQFYKQMAQSAGFGKIFEVGPAFRADHSFTSRHATEFTSVDTEISWIDSHEDVMNLHEELLVAGFTAVKAKHGDAIKELFDVEITVPSRPFPRIPLAEAKQIVAERGYEIPRADDDMDPEGERQISAYVAEKLGHEFVFITDYASSIRPFYHMRHEGDPSLTNSYDLLFNGTEISTGAQREHRIDVLVAQAEDKGMDPEELGTYLDFFRYGVPPHGGFGMGLARVLMLMLHQASIREVTYLFRGPTRLEP
ncbi:aspartate--tRNA(Asn) ligase [Microterricola pindariensis]|uniref:Aspartate--tRNA ligase n=1 Tax=Microterricola pindariensis TaxID=478010 RepID=A0ABX5ATA6_9MICO|nr:aspartate--tRNA(Asn) ligase [Microterricola pindariensis]PPL16328.1 aspartate--tRNA(Asn) ligase [Microterricola pindariensis]